MQLHAPAFEWPPRGRVVWRQLLAMLLAALLALQAVRLVWLLIVVPGPIGAFQAAVAGNPLQAASAPAADPFFPATSASGAAADASGMVLYGISFSPAGPSAILGKAPDNQDSYRVGETIESGITLVEVAGSHVLLQVNGAISRLEFSAPATFASHSPGALPSAAPAASPEGSPAGVDPAQFLAQAGLSPLNEDGKVAGYTLIPRGDGALLRQAGLQAGDVLLSVNGQSLTPELYQSLAEELAAESRIDITFRRGGETRTTSMQAKTP